MPMTEWLMRFADSDVPAYRCRQGILRYRELIVAARRVASLLSQTVPSGSPVGIYGHKELLMPVCIAACTLAGLPYLPIDRQIPSVRAERMLRLAGARLLLCAAAPPWTPPVPFLSSDKLESAAFSPALSPAEPVRTAPDDPFYLLFTSGSSGEPKGIRITRRNAASFLRWEQSLLGAGEGPVLNHAAFSFDLSVAALWFSFLNGRCDAELESELFGDFPALFDAMDQSAPSLAVLTPSFAELLLASPSFGANRFPALGQFLFCGETLRPQTVRRLKLRFPTAHIYNSYGPTETTVAVTGCELTEVMLQQPLLPIGYVGTRSSITIRDPSSHVELPEGETGELVVTGEQVAAGYLGEIQGGFCRIDSRPAYRTGDLGWQRDGLFYCRGRIDRQLKWRGLRIEPEEIERCLLQCEGILQAAVVPVLQQGRVRRLRAFVVLSSGIHDPQSIKLQLRTLLPAGMIPDLTALPHLPLTSHGKCDYTALKELL